MSIASPQFIGQHIAIGSMVVSARDYPGPYSQAGITLGGGRGGGHQMIRGGWGCGVCLHSSCLGQNKSEHILWGVGGGLSFPRGEGGPP